MADEEQLAILRQGVEVWNQWRAENRTAEIDLIKADLIGINLQKADLSGANMWAADLSGASLFRAELFGTDLGEANLREADLRQAQLIGADLNKANLREANLSDAHLQAANLTWAILIGAKLNRADLSQANLMGANLNGASMGITILGDIDFSETAGLEQVTHEFSSSVDINTIRRFKGKVPEIFLRGCGLSDWEIESAKLYNPDLSNDEFIYIQNRIFDLRQRQALQISPLFISYSHADGTFVEKLESHLNQKGVRFWRDIHDATAGRLEKQLGRAIRLNPTVLLILSEHALQSDWVEHEVRTARSLEKEMGRDVLCPVALDDSWKNSPWPRRVMEQVLEYNILDFSDWKDDNKFGGIFNKLIDGLELFYKG